MEKGISTYIVNDQMYLSPFPTCKGDGDPGWLTLWRGWRKLSLLVCGYEMRIA